MNQFDHQLHESLGTESRNAAEDIIEDFFRIFHLVEAKEELLTLQDMAIKEGIFKSQDKAEELVYFCEKLKELIGAAHQFRKSNWKIS